jgi:general secretion pathway protein M
MRRLSPRESRLVAIGILVAVIAVAWLLLVEPLIAGFSTRADERATLLQTYATNQNVVAGAQVWKAQLDEQNQTAGRYAISAPTEALAAEQLKNRLSRMTSESGGTLTAIQDVQDGVPTGYVRVRADMQMTLGQLYKTLERLESEEPYVVVESLSVVADSALKTGHLGPMAVRMEVSSAVRISQSS